MIEIMTYFLMISAIEPQHTSSQSLSNANTNTQLNIHNFDGQQKQVHKTTSTDSWQHGTHQDLVSERRKDLID